MTCCHCEYILFKLPVSFIVPEVTLVHVEQTFEVTWHVCMYINMYIHHRPSKIMESTLQICWPSSHMGISSHETLPAETVRASAFRLLASVIPKDPQ